MKTYLGRPAILNVNMSRELSEYDWQIFRKLCPELPEGSRYRSILPPLSRFYSKSKEDFVQRVERLTDEELDYLIGLVENGEECLSCIVPEYKEAFVEMVERRSPKRAEKFRKLIDFLETPS